MQFSQMLTEYLDLRDAEKKEEESEDLYYRTPIQDRIDRRLRMSDLLESLDEIVEANKGA